MGARIVLNTKIHTAFLLFFCLFSSCNNKTASKNYADIFEELNQDKPEMIYPVEYYKDQIIEFQQILQERRRINSIERIDNIIPGFLSFLVGYDDFNVGRGDDFDIVTNAGPRGNFFGLYSFDKAQNIVSEYQVGYKNYLDSIRNILLEKIPGNKPEYGLVSYGDFNNDGINLIASIYLHPPQYEYVFSIFGYDAAENEFVQLLLAPIYIHFEQPYPPVEYLENGFRVMEIIDKDYLDLAWIDYIWDKSVGGYVKKVI